MWSVTVPRVAVRNATGSGDLFLAGFVSEISRGRDLESALVFGSACGIANAMNLLPELPLGADLPTHDHPLDLGVNVLEPHDQPAGMEDDLHIADLGRDGQPQPAGPFGAFGQQQRVDVGVADVQPGRLGR